MMLRPFTALMIACALPGCAYHSLTVPVPNRGDQNLHPVTSNAIAWGAGQNEADNVYVIDLFTF